MAGLNGVGQCERGLVNAIRDGAAGREICHVLDKAGQVDETNTWASAQTFSTTVTITAGGLTITAGGETITAGDLTLTAGNIVFGAASARVIPGATSLLFRNAANDNTNVTITDAGAVTTRAGLTVTSGGATVTAGGITVTAGGETITAGDLTMTAGNVVFGAASARVIPGATSLLFRNNANNADNLSITDAGLCTARAGVVATTGGVTATAGGLTATAGGLLVTAGRIREVMTPTDVDAQNHTLTAANIFAGILIHTSVTGGGTVTTDTGTNIVSGCNLTADGQCIIMHYVNDGDQTVTFAAGTDVTISDTGNTIVTNKSCSLLFRRTTATTVAMHIIGG